MQAGPRWSIRRTFYSPFRRAAGVLASINAALQIEALISKVTPFPEGAEWFKRIHDGEAGLMKGILMQNGAA